MASSDAHLTLDLNQADQVSTKNVDRETMHRKRPALMVLMALAVVAMLGTGLSMGRAHGKNVITETQFGRRSLQQSAKPRQLTLCLFFPYLSICNPKPCYSPPPPPPKPYVYPTCNVNNANTCFANNAKKVVNWDGSITITLYNCVLSDVSYVSVDASTCGAGVNILNSVQWWAPIATFTVAARDCAKGAYVNIYYNDEQLPNPTFVPSFCRPSSWWLPGPVASTGCSYQNVWIPTTCAAKSSPPPPPPSPPPPPPPSPPPPCSSPPPPPPPPSPPPPPPPSPPPPPPSPPSTPPPFSPDGPMYPPYPDTPSATVTSSPPPSPPPPPPPSPPPPCVTTRSSPPPPPPCVTPTPSPASCSWWNFSCWWSNGWGR